MANFALPYGREKLNLEVPDDKLAGVLVSNLEEYDPGKEQSQLVLEAMADPIGSPRLKELAKGKQKVVLIASDHTRPVPSKHIVPHMLQEIREGNPDADITILIATGCHRGTTVAELKEKFGAEIAEKEKIVVHDCADESMLVKLGTLPSGGDLVVNKLAAEADLLVSEGFIEPHFFAGFSGGRKSVLPGVASRETVLSNHCGEFIADEHSRTGILEGNLIHKDMVYAAVKTGLAYIVNVVINSEKKVINAFAGDCVKAHEAGCAFLSTLCKVNRSEADIVITTNGGYPLDQNIYQAVKGMTAAEASVRKNGVIIMAAASNDGHGGEEFYRQLKNKRDEQALLEKYVATPKNKTVPDQWQIQILLRILLKATVIYISEAPDEMITDLHMIPAHSMEEALEKAYALVGREASVTVIPDGVAVMVI